MCLYMAICVSALCAYLCYVYTNTSGTGISPHGEESWVVLSPDNTEIDNSVAQDMYDDEDSANSVTNASLSSRPAFTRPEAQLGSRGAGVDHRGGLLVDGERALTHDMGVSGGSTDSEDEYESSSSHPTTPPENVCDTECDDAGGLGVRDGTAARMLSRNGSLPERTCPTTHRKIDGQTDNRQTDRHTHTHTHTQMQRSTRRQTRILEYLPLSKFLPPSMAAMVRRKENRRRGELRGRSHQARGRLKSGFHGVFLKEKPWPLRGLPLSLSLFSSFSPGS